jgi:hypothetical protein
MSRGVKRIRRGRPLGPIAAAVLERLHAQPAPVSLLAAELQLSVKQANDTVVRLVRGGYAAYGTAVPGQHDRPARLVQAVVPAEPAEAGFPGGFPFIFWR